MALPDQMSFEERFVTFYLCALSRYKTDWFLDNLGLHWMERLFEMLVLIWENHPNATLSQHAHRLCAAFLQVHPLWVTIVSQSELKSQHAGVSFYSPMGCQPPARIGG